MPRALSLFALACLCLGVVSCSHYRLGNTTAPTFTTLHIAVVESETPLPQARALISTQLRDAFLKDGRVRLVNSSAQADATLTVTLENYSRTVVVARPDDTGLARRFELTLQARATLTDQRTQVAQFTDRALSARSDALTDSGQQQAEYQALPLLAAQLAEITRQAVLDRW